MPRGKQGRKTPRASEERYRALFENALEGIFRSTPEGHFLEVNPALVRMLGYESVEEVLALRLPLLISMWPPRSVSTCALTTSLRG